MKRWLTIAVCFLGFALGSVANVHEDRLAKLADLTKSNIRTTVTSETRPSLEKGSVRNSKQSGRDYLTGTPVRRSKQSMRAPEGEKVHVTFRFPAIGEETEWMMPWLTIKVYNGEDYYEEVEVKPYDEEGNPVDTSEWICELPAGTFDIASIFCRRNFDRFSWQDPFVYYIVEDADLKEGAVIELHPEESTICLQMYPTIPNGDKVRLPQYSFDENWNMETFDEGNISDDSMCKEIYYKGEQIELLLTNSGVEIMPGPQGDQDPYANMNFYVNRVSDKYTFRVIHIMSAWPDESKGFYIAVTEAEGAKEGVYTNAGYSLNDQAILPTPAHEKYPLTETENQPIYPYGISVRPYGATIAYGIQSSTPNIWKIWNSKPESPIFHDETFYSMNRSFEEAEIPHPDYGYSTISTIYSTDIFPLAEEGSTYCQFGPGNYMKLLPDGHVPDVLMPGNEPFMSFVDDTRISAGGSTPLLTSYIYSTYDFDTSRMVGYIDGLYSGRVGEIIGSDFDLAGGYLKVDGKEVASNIESAQDWMIENPDYKGKYEVEISTDNFEIEGMKGGNRATVSFDTASEDGIPPTVTFLQTRKGGNIVTQIFDTPRDGEICLSAADLTICYSTPDEDGWQYAYCEMSTPAKVTATVTPTGSTTEEYEEIVLTEEPDKFYTPGFGAFYRGSLESVNLTSQSGWFDLTIMVEDAAGNRQVQTLSPAFKIESLASSVRTIGEEKIRVVGNDILVDGPAKIYNLAGQAVKGQDLAAGVYFVALPENTIKVIVK